MLFRKREPTLSPLAYLHVQKMPWRNWHHELRVFVPPTAVEIVLLRSVEIETQNRVVGKGPFFIPVRLSDTPPVRSQSIRSTPEQVPYAVDPKAPSRLHLRSDNCLI